MERTIHRTQIENQIAALLYAYNFVSDDEEITEIKIGGLNVEDVPITFTVVSSREKSNEASSDNGSSRLLARIKQSGAGAEPSGSGPVHSAA